MIMSKTKVLFLCTGNSARSQMAEAFLRQYAGDQFEAYSAGLEAKGINPYTERVMREIGLDISGQYSKHVREYIGKMHFGYLITVCADAEAKCPTTFPGIGRRLHWGFEDPAAFVGSEKDTLQKFREVRHQIAQRIRAWLKEQGIEINALSLQC
jgi:arsenate reductase